MHCNTIQVNTNIKSKLLFVNHAEVLLYKVATARRGDSRTVALRRVGGVLTTGFFPVLLCDIPRSIMTGTGNDMTLFTGRVTYTQQQ